MTINELSFTSTDIVAGKKIYATNEAARWAALLAWANEQVAAKAVDEDGDNPMDANLPMGNNKITGLGDGTAPTDAAAYGQITTALADYVQDSDFTPSSYAGEQSITLPNGLIVKIGEISMAEGTQDVEYTTPFPTAFTWAMVCMKGTNTSMVDNPGVEPKSGEETDKLTILNSSTGTYTLYWMAIGY